MEEGGYLSAGDGSVGVELGGCHSGGDAVLDGPADGFVGPMIGGYVIEYVGPFGCGELC